MNFKKGENIKPRTLRKLTKAIHALQNNAPGREVDSVAWSHFAASTQKALKEGKTFDQMKQARIQDPRKKYSGDFITEDTYLETLFNSLTGRTSGKFIKHN